MSIVSFLIAVCMVGSGLTGSPAPGPASAPPTAVDQGAAAGTDGKAIPDENQPAR